MISKNFFFLVFFLYLVLACEQGQRGNVRTTLRSGKSHVLYAVDVRCIYLKKSIFGRSKMLFYFLRGFSFRIALHFFFFLLSFRRFILFRGVLFYKALYKELLFCLFFDVFFKSQCRVLICKDHCFGYRMGKY